MHKNSNDINFKSYITNDINKNENKNELNKNEFKGGVGKRNSDEVYSEMLKRDEVYIKAHT
jgi:hypothetical protein